MIREITQVDEEKVYGGKHLMANTIESTLFGVVTRRLFFYRNLSAIGNALHRFLLSFIHTSIYCMKLKSLNYSSS